MTPLENELVELGRHLDHSDGTHLLSIASQHDHRLAWVRPLRIAAVIVVALGIVIASFAPARRAVARLFGIGAVRIVTSPTTLPLAPTTTAPPAPTTTAAPVPPTATTTATTATGPSASDPLADARARLAFAPLLPTAEVGDIDAVEIDESVPGGLLLVRYRRFSLIEVSSTGEAVPYLSKIVGPGTTIDNVTVRGERGYWLAGEPHEVAYNDRNGDYRLDTVRRAGNVLLWTQGSLTLRIEGIADKAAALAIAETIG
jgi:hypothetical protein